MQVVSFTNERNLSCPVLLVPSSQGLKCPPRLPSGQFQTPSCRAALAWLSQA